jgi:signal peptidase I
MNWEFIGWAVIAVSFAIIVWNAVTKLNAPKTASGKAIETDANATFPIALEISWPALFIACMAMLTFKEIMGFAAVLLFATVLTGVIWLIDSLAFKKRRVAAAVAAQAKHAPHDPAVVEMAKSFFPVILIVFLLRSFLYEPFKIPSGSMVPSLLIGDFILVNKYTYGVRLPVINKKVMDMNLPQRSDVMVFRYPPDPSKDYIKRVVGIPGDVIEYRAKRLTVNGKELSVKETGTFTETLPLAYYRTFSEGLADKPHQIMTNDGRASLNLYDVMSFPKKDQCQYTAEFMRCTVPAGHYFMMGDSRDNSLDSRYWGFVPEENIVGKAVLVWMNFGDFKRVGTKIE